MARIQVGRYLRNFGCFRILRKGGDHSQFENVYMYIYICVWNIFLCLFTLVEFTYKGWNMGNTVINGLIMFHCLLITGRYVWMIYLLNLGDSQVVTFPRLGGSFHCDSAWYSVAWGEIGIITLCILVLCECICAIESHPSRFNWWNSKNMTYDSRILGIWHGIVAVDT